MTETKNTDTSGPTEAQLPTALVFGCGETLLSLALQASEEARAELVLRDCQGHNAGPIGGPAKADHPRRFDSDAPQMPPADVVRLIFDNAPGLENLIRELVTLHHARYPGQPLGLSPRPLGPEEAALFARFQQPQDAPQPEQVQEWEAAAEDLEYWLEELPTSNSDRYAMCQVARTVLEAYRCTRAELEAAQNCMLQHNGCAAPSLLAGTPTPQPEQALTTEQVRALLKTYEEAYWNLGEAMDAREPTPEHPGLVMTDWQRARQRQYQDALGAVGKAFPDLARDLLAERTAHDATRAELEQMRERVEEAEKETSRVLDGLQYEYDATDSRWEAALYLNALNGVRSIAQALTPTQEAQQ